MTAYCMRARARKPFRLTKSQQPDLFEWSASQLAIDAPAMPRVARKVAARFGLPQNHARLVCELAGFQMEASNHG